MGIQGQYVNTFAEANLASAVDVHINGDYQFFFDVVGVERDMLGEAVLVILRPHGSDEVWRKEISRKKNGRESITYVHKGAYTGIFGGKGEVVEVVPFKGEKW